MTNDITGGLDISTSNFEILDTLNLDENGDKFVGYMKSEPAGCWNRCQNILSRYGMSTPADDRYHVFKLIYESGNQLVYFGNSPKDNYAEAIACIDRHLENGRPITVGVNRHIGRGINEKATDHFILIYGRKKVMISGREYKVYMYYEVGTSHKDRGTNHARNVLIYNTDDPERPTFYNPKPQLSDPARYDVTQVRPNDGNVVGTVSQYAVDESDKKDSTYVYTPPHYNSSLQYDGKKEDRKRRRNGRKSRLGSGDEDNEEYIEDDGFGTYDSLGLSTIFGEVFPDDDNNRYIDMSSEDISVIQYSEPTLTVDELKIPSKSIAAMGVSPDKISYSIPLVVVNEYVVPQTYITNFCLDYTAFTPQVMVEFVDMTNELLSTNVPKPGSYIKVFIGGYGDEKYYKPIRQDFVITNINKTNKTGGEYQNYPNSGNPIKYKLTGILNVPLGFRKMPWASSMINARQAMFNISNTVGVGFATNFATNNEVDVMRWINTQNRSYYDFMKEITLHSCYSPYTFFTSFIDQYYVLNYVECRRLLSHGGKKEDLPQVIYNCIMPDMEEDASKKTSDDIVESENQKVSYYFLTNSSKFKGWTNYIEEYFEINDGYSIVSDGYRKSLTYSDKCGFPDITSKNFKFVISPIDNLRRDNNKNILSLPDKVGYDTYIPLNLRQTTSSAYSECQSFYDNPTVAESTIDMGEVDTSNTFPLYFYASVQNDFQMKSLKKCGLSIRLQNYNPSITRFSRIWVDIYDMHNNSITQIRKNDSVNDMSDSILKEYLKKKNDNIILFDEDLKDDTQYQKYNRSLSGWYVVTDMKISYNTVKDFKGVMHKKLQTHLTLNRVDYKPAFYTEYDIAKKAIEKYKNDNISENIMSTGDEEEFDSTDDSVVAANSGSNANSNANNSTKNEDKLNEFFYSADNPAFNSVFNMNYMDHQDSVVIS